MKGSAAGAGFSAGAAIGLIAGGLEGFLFLTPGNLTGTPLASIWFFAASVGIYCAAFALAGAVVGLMVEASRRGASGDTERAQAHGRAIAVGVLVGAIGFLAGAWLVRPGPPDLSIFRMYCLDGTARVFGVSAVLGVVAYAFSRWRFVGRLLSSTAVLRSAVIVVALTGTAAAMAAFGQLRQYHSELQPDRTSTNVVLVTIDTLRAEHLGYLGYDRPTSPFIDGLSERSVVFEEAVAHFPLTTPSHASILTGRYVRSHGATGNCVPIVESAPLLSEILREEGYATAGFVTGIPVSQRYGFGRGFDHFVDRERVDFRTASVADALGQLKLSRTIWRWTGRDRLSTAVARWIRRKPGQPFFLWIHQIAPHLPYSPPFRYERAFDRARSSLATNGDTIGRINSHEFEPSSDDLEHMIGLYDAEIAFTDHILERIFLDLESSGYLDDAIVVFTADHGEKLYDRSNYIGHGYTLYDEEIIVPLFFFSPSRLAEPARIGVCVETIDIAPTVMELLGLPLEPSFQGVSLMPLMEGGEEDGVGRAVGLETRRAAGKASGPDGRRAHPQREAPTYSIDENSKMLRYRGWKYIKNADGREELYDLGTDPGEVRDLASERPNRLAELRELLHAWDAGIPVAREEAHELDEESIRALESLGYIQ